MASTNLKQQCIQWVVRKVKSNTIYVNQRPQKVGCTGKTEKAQLELLATLAVENFGRLHGYSRFEQVSLSATCPPKQHDNNHPLNAWVKRLSILFSLWRSYVRPSSEIQGMYFYAATMIDEFGTAALKDPTVAKCLNVLEDAVTTRIEPGFTSLVKRKQVQAQLRRLLNSMVPPLRGKKEVPSPHLLLEQYKQIQGVITQAQKRYRNTHLTKANLLKTYRFLTESQADDIALQNEIRADAILAAYYGPPSSTIRRWLTDARKELRGLVHFVTELLGGPFGRSPQLVKARSENQRRRVLEQIKRFLPPEECRKLNLTSR